MKFGDIEFCLVSLFSSLIFGVAMALWRGKGVHYDSLTLKTFTKKQMKNLEKKWYWFLYKGQARGKNNLLTIFGFWFQTIGLLYCLSLTVLNVVLIFLSKTKIATFITISTIIPYFILGAVIHFSLERRTKKQLQESQKKIN